MKNKIKIMNFENYIDEIAQLIESNINRINSRIIHKNTIYSMRAENIFELTLEEYERLSEIVNEISKENNLKSKFPKNYIFDQLVREVIIKSYFYMKNLKNGLILYLFQALKLKINSLLVL